MSIGDREGSQRYYADGITRVTDPFWKVTCGRCGHIYLSCIAISSCPTCGCPDGVRFLGEVPYDDVVTERGEPELNFKYSTPGDFENQNKSE